MSNSSFASATAPAGAGGTLSDDERAALAGSPFLPVNVTIPRKGPGPEFDRTPGYRDIQLPHEEFKLRIGPDYKKNKKKAPSLDAMFEVVSVDWYTHGRCIRPIGPLLDLPEPKVKSPIPEVVPPLYIFNIGMSESNFVSSCLDRKVTHTTII